LPKIYRKTCDYCGNYYEGQGDRYCGLECSKKARLGIKAEDVKFPTPGVEIYNDFWRLQGDYIISSDWHIPYYDNKLADHLIKIAKKFKIKKMIIAGDFTDQAAFRAILYNNSQIGISEEDLGYTFSITAEVINILLDTFDEIRILTGNHDIYLLKVLQGKLKLETFWKLIGVSKKEFNKRVFVSKYPFCSLNKTWHITHPKTYSRIPMNVSRAISTKYRMSVLSAHGHQMGLSTDISGKDICGDSGGMFDYKKIGYKWLSDTTHPQWINGFSIIRKNKIYLFSDAFTDWKFWEKEITIQNR